jgi:pSer/pThr/pTyr-binding forkhead associated (FHA) protein
MTVQINITRKDGTLVYEIPLEIDASLISIGRSSSCNFSIDDNLLSKLHATLEITKSGKVIFTDNKSSNGSSCAGNKITTLEMKINDKVRIGNHYLQVDHSKLTTTEKRKIGTNDNVEELLTLPSVSKTLCETKNIISYANKKKT